MVCAAIAKCVDAPVEALGFRYLVTIAIHVDAHVVADDDPASWSKLEFCVLAQFIYKFHLAETRTPNHGTKRYF